MTPEELSYLLNKARRHLKLVRKIRVRAVNKGESIPPDTFQPKEIEQLRAAAELIKAVDSRLRRYRDPRPIPTPATPGIGRELEPQVAGLATLMALHESVNQLRARLDEATAPTSGDPHATALGAIIAAVCELGAKFDTQFPAPPAPATDAMHVLLARMNEQANDVCELHMKFDALSDGGLQRLRDGPLHELIRLYDRLAEEANQRTGECGDVLSELRERTLEALRKEGLSRVPGPAVGERYSVDDPRVEVIGSEMADDREDDLRVARCVVCAFVRRADGRVIRPARVVVKRWDAARTPHADTEPKLTGVPNGDE